MKCLIVICKEEENLLKNHYKENKIIDLLEKEEISYKIAYVNDILEEVNILKRWWKSKRND